ncbi:MAG: FAD-dependent oxidoreductase [Bacteroidota bacterium]|nr:FAD-dependent oxidoreductase [Bacteroidota bacterium]
MDKKVIIIGGGIAGLSAGCYGQINGYETEIIEMHSVPGGQCTAWKRKDYLFDYCIHWLVGTAKGIFNEVWKETGALNDNVEIINHEVQTCYIDQNNQKYFVYSDIDKWEKYLLEMAPEDKEPIRKMCSDIRKLSSLDNFNKPAELRNIGDYLKIMLKSGSAVRILMKYSKMDCAAYFNKMGFTNAKLRYFFYFAFETSELPAIAFLMMISWFGSKNAGYPVGGSFNFAKRIADKYTSLGGKLTLNKKVKNIIVKDNTAVGVTLEDGVEKYADYIISTSDLHTTINDFLNGKYVSKEIEKGFNNWKLFTPIIQVSFGIKKRIDFSYPTYSYFSPGIKIGSTTLKSGFVLRNFNFDTIITPDGKTVITMLFESPWQIWENMNKDNYVREKKLIEEDSRKLLEKYYPEISNDIEECDVATPLTDIKYTGVWKASFEGWLPTTENLGKEIKMTIQGLNNFYLAGQWLYPGGGLPPSALSGKWVFHLICKKDKKKFILK